MEPLVARVQPRVDKRFDTLCTEIHELKSELQTVQQTLARIEGKMTNSVWQGVGNAS